MKPIYERCMNEVSGFRHYLDQCYQQHPELFPVGFERDYTLQGFVNSKKQALKTHRIKVSQTGEAYQIRPSFVMPYMIGRTEEIEKGLYFKRWGAPSEGLAYGFGHVAMF